MHTIFVKPAGFPANGPHALVVVLSADDNPENVAKAYFDTFKDGNSLNPDMEYFLGTFDPEDVLENRINTKTWRRINLDGTIGPDEGRHEADF